MISVFQSIKKSSNVLKEVPLSDFLNEIQGGNNKELIENIRYIYSLGQKEKYNQLKQTKLPAYNLNFTFEGNRRNNLIKSNSGYIYIDIDGDTDINLNHPLIYSSWLSLSGTGRGLIVKVNNLTKTNFKYNYQIICEELEIEGDLNASKPTQLTVLSYDSNIYINSNSDLWEAKNDIKTNEVLPHHVVNFNNTSTVYNVLGHFENRLRFDNVNEYIDTIDFQGKLVFDAINKIYLSKVYHEFIILEGNRYSRLNAQAYQLRTLNPNINENQLSEFMFSQNRFRCRPPLNDFEITLIINNVMKIPQTSLIPRKNYPRRFFFNPSYDLSRRHKRSLVMKGVNKKRSKISIEKIRRVIKSWDVTNSGRITNKKLTTNSGLNKKTVEKYKFHFKSEIEKINASIKNRC